MLIEDIDPMAQEELLSVSEEIRLTWQLFISKRMLKLVPLMMWTAISCAIYTSTFYPFLSQGFSDDVSAEEQLQKMAFSSIALGVGETIGVLIFG